MGTLRKKVQLVLPALLVLAAVAQMGFVAREYLLPWGWRVKQVADEPRLLRSADLSVGVPGARVVEFVNEVVPEEATILLPPSGQPERFAVARSMQYFFFPRQVIGCGSAERPGCVEALADPEIYVLATEGFPDRGLVQDRQFTASPGGTAWFTGVYGPDFGNPEPLDKISFVDYLRWLPANLGLLLALGLLGFGVALALSQRWDTLELLSLSLPLGAGFVTFSTFLLSWAGIEINLRSVGGLLLALAAGTVFLLYRRRASFRSEGTFPDEGRGGLLGFQLIPLGLGLLLFLMVTGLSVGASYRLFDPVQIWSVKGYGISHWGTILAAEDWGVHALAYPLNIPMQVSLFHLLDGDVVPGSKFLYPIYGAALCLAIYSFLRKQDVDRLTASAGGLFLGSVPIFVFHASSGFANLPYSFYLIAGTLWMIQGLDDGRSGTQLVAGMLLGLAAWTRPEGFLFAGLVLLVGGFMVVAMGWGRLRPWSLLLPPVIIAGIWFLFVVSGSHLSGSNLQEAVSVYSEETISGRLDLSGLFTIFRIFGYSMFIPYRAMFPAVSATAWGVFFPLVLLFLALNPGLFRRRTNPKAFALTLSTVLIAALTVGVFYIRSYSKPGYESFIERAFPRAFLPSALLLGVMGVWAANQWLSDRQANSEEGIAWSGREKED